MPLMKRVTKTSILTVLEKKKSHNCLLNFRGPSYKCMRKFSTLENYRIHQVHQSSSSMTDYNEKNVDYKKARAAV